MMEHIKTPVTVDTYRALIVDASGYNIMGYMADMQAAEAARAINAHDALIGTCEMLIQMLVDFGPSQLTDGELTAIGEAQSALKLAKGGE